MKPSDHDLVLYADLKLSAAREQQLLAAAEHDPELAKTLAALDASRLSFRQAFEQQPLPPLPDKLRADIKGLLREAGNAAWAGIKSPAAPEVAAGAGNPSVSSRVTSTPSVRKTSRKITGLPLYAAQAVCVVLSVAAGFVIGTYQAVEQPANDQMAVSDALPAHALHLAWVERVADYQTLYVPNTVSDIEADLMASMAKLNGLGQAAGMRTAIPDLSESGYQFARVQELGYEGNTLVQVVYSKPEHPPLALCFMSAGGADDLPLQIGERHGLGTASWVDGNQRFVIVADESPETLTALYQSSKGLFVSG